jgi:hypothetical protein
MKPGSFFGNLGYSERCVNGAGNWTRVVGKHLFIWAG